ncbi:uncharacterized protein LOC125234163 [Leguminivora glycinivorella]|uniref:uncharacterized protein LOC125234163 n=1 Tax=Leguminivora glycinivorella TaxID=1035111 RepID=UPI00200E6782|nr:uncharacterized protein LOC125234163 [Leguminivora glycinivorella]
MAAARRIQLLQMKHHTACRSIDVLDALARNPELSPEQESDFIVRFQDLEKVYETFTEMFYELQLSAADIESFDLESHLQEYDAYNKKYYFIKQRHLGLTNLNASANADNSCSSGSNNDNPKSARNRVVLPKVKLPTFAGQVEEFVPFMELFQSLVGNDATLSDTEKMYYLAGSLLGEPKTLTQHLSVTGDNFSVAIDLLNARYNNKRLLADRLLHNLLSAPHVTSKGVTGLKMFLNTLIENTKALEKMEFPVDSWCYLLFYINFQKLDGNLKKHFEDKHADKELPTFADLIKFLETEIRILESSAEPQASASAGRRIGGGQSQAVKAHAAFQGAGSASTCRLCGKSGHFIAKCEKFLEMKPAARKRQVVSLRLCFKCLNGHNIDKCTYNKNCYKCNSAKHHYLLHFDIPASGSDREQRLTSNVATNGKSHNAASSSSSVPVVSAPLTSGNPEGAVPGVSGLMASQAMKPKVLLATAIIRVLDSSGRYQEARALLDGGSESTFISESCVQRLGLERFKPDDPITGLGCTPITGCRGAVNLTMTPRLTDQPVLVTTANVLNKISYNLPGYSLPAQLADNYRGLDLADEQFFVSREIDILLGEDLLCDIVLSGRIKIHDHIPRVTKTVFGHVLSGPVNIGVSLRIPCASQAFFCSTSTDRILERFWEVEDIPFKAENPKDLECETIFRDTHSRTEEGRYSARLPFISDAPELGNTVPIAMKRFLAMERRLLAKGNEVFREKYTEFMREYAETGHMSLCEGEPNDYASGSYIIPHHGIFKKDSDKIRVVFDASCASTNGVALNDCLHAGPKLQRDIAEIICRFRLHRYVFTTDIRMMFRQILIAEEDRRFQLIFWRESPDLPLRVYRLNTVTYGMKSSPYLAIRTLRQLADDEEMQFPAAAQLLRSSVYMDDILGGADSIEDAGKLKQELTDLLRSGGFEFSKWTSSSKEVLKDIEEEHLEKPRKIFDNADGPSFYKILGVQWDSSSDCFSYRTKLDDTSGCTKRSILSTLARAFDPLGWICPVIFQGKVLMQQLWLKNLSWDANAPDDVVAEWQGILKDMPLISNLRLERFVLLDVKSCSLHGFSDASELWYGAAVYLRTVGHDGRVKHYRSLVVEDIATFVADF